MSRGDHDPVVSGGGGRTLGDVGEKRFEVGERQRLLGSLLGCVRPEGPAFRVHAERGFGPHCPPRRSGAFPQRASAHALREFQKDASAPASAQGGFRFRLPRVRSEEHTSELQSLMRISYAVFCLKKKK